MKYKANKAALRELLRGEVAQKLVNEHSERLAQRAGEGYTASYLQGRNRYRGIVYADTMRAKVKEARNNNLLRVLG